MFTAKDFNPLIDEFICPTTTLDEISLRSRKRNRFAVKQANTTLQAWRNARVEADERLLQKSLNIDNAPKMLPSFFPEVDGEDLLTQDEMFHGEPDYADLRMATKEQDYAIWKGMRKGKSAEILANKPVLSGKTPAQIKNRYRVLTAVCRTAKFAEDITIHGYGISRPPAHDDDDDRTSAILSTDSLSDYCFKCKKLAELLVRCDDCGMWFDFECAGLSEAPSEEEQWFCATCIENKFVDDSGLDPETETKALKMLPFGKAMQDAGKWLKGDDEEAEELVDDKEEEETAIFDTQLKDMVVKSDYVTKAWQQLVKVDDTNAEFDRITQEIESKHGFITKKLSEIEGNMLAQYSVAEEEQLKNKKEEKATNKRLKASPSPPAAAGDGGGVLSSTSTPPLIASNAFVSLTTTTTTTLDGEQPAVQQPQPRRVPMIPVQVEKQTDDEKS